jgi:hypothetical protein
MIIWNLLECGLSHSGPSLGVLTLCGVVPRVTILVIQNLKYSRYSPNWMLWFGKPKHPIFPVSERGEVCEAIVFHSSHLRFFGYVEH